MDETGLGLQLMPNRQGLSLTKREQGSLDMGEPSAAFKGKAAAAHVVLRPCRLASTLAVSMGIPRAGPGPSCTPQVPAGPRAPGLHSRASADPHLWGSPPLPLQVMPKPPGTQAGPSGRDLLPGLRALAGTLPMWQPGGFLGAWD